MIIANSELTEALNLVQFLHEPDKPPTSSNRWNATRPDGYLVLKQRLSEGVVSWAKISLSCENKWNDSNKNFMM